MPELYVSPNARADFDLDVQLFDAFALERLDLGLADFDLAARELPATRELGWLGSSARENPSVFDDCRADNDPGRRPFGLHEPSDCQIFARSGTLGVPISAVASDLWP
jgi:hypothetical protein